MTMHKGLNIRDDVDRLYIYIYIYKEGGTGFVYIEHIIDASIQQREDYIEKYEGGRITTTRIYPDNTKFNRMTITRYEKCEEK